MYPIRVDIILFACVMVHLQRVFGKASTLEVMQYIKAFPEIHSWFYLMNHLYIL